MTILAYLSNISPAWPIERQEKLLAADRPGFPRGVAVSQDILHVRQRRAHSTAALVKRGNLLRPTTRQGGTTLLVASLAVMAWSAEDMMAVLAEAHALRMTVRVLDVALTLSPNGGPAGLRDAVKAWTTGRKAEVARRGFEVARERRVALADAGVAKIKERWPMPSSEWSTVALIAEAGVSRNTIHTRLGPRPAAQRQYQAALKRAATRKAKADG